MFRPSSLASSRRFAANLSVTHSIEGGGCGGRRSTLLKQNNWCTPVLIKRNVKELGSDKKVKTRRILLEF